MKCENFRIKYIYKLFIWILRILKPEQMKKFVYFPGVFNLISYNTGWHQGSQLTFTDRVIQRFDLATPLRDRTSFVQAHIELNEEKKKKTRRVPNVTRIFKSDGTAAPSLLFSFFQKFVSSQAFPTIFNNRITFFALTFLFQSLSLSLCSLALEICVRLRTTPK